MRFIVLISLFLFTLSACNKEDPKEEQAKEDEAIILKYISENNLDAKSTSSGLHYVIQEQGTGARPNANSSVTVKYKGYFTDGNVFDQSSSINFSLNQVIQGWQEGIPLFNASGKGILLIPSHLGYGENGSGSSVPPNTVLIFDIELKKVTN